MSNFSFSEFVTSVAKAVKEIEINNLMTELEAFNRKNYKDTAIDVALETGDRKAFEKLVGVK